MQPLSRNYRERPNGNNAHLRNWLSDMDSNHDKGLQRALCYHYTIGQYAGKVASFPGCAKQIFRFNTVEIHRLDSCHSTPDSCPMSSYWLVKQEPEAYSWQTFLKEKRAAWTGVRNFQARNN